MVQLLQKNTAASQRRGGTERASFHQRGDGGGDPEDV